RVRVAYDAPRTARRRGALSWPEPRSDRSGHAVPQVVRGDADDYTHPPAEHGGDLRDHRGGRRAVCLRVRALEALSHRRAVLRLARLLLGDVADALCGAGVQLAPRGVELPRG